MKDQMARIMKVRNVFKLFFYSIPPSLFLSNSILLVFLADGAKDEKMDTSLPSEDKKGACMSKLIHT